MDKQYKKLIRTILKEGYWYNDPNRKGTKRLQINDYKLVHSFDKGFPILTSKKIFYEGAFGELISFLRGENNIKQLKKNKVNFWDKDAYNYFLKHYDSKKSFSEFIEMVKEGYYDGRYYTYGDLGKIYPYQMRKWNGEIDQLKNLIKTLKENPMVTKKTVTMWNPSDLEDSALSPCHWSFEAIVSPLEESYGLTIKWHQHSTDVFLGLPLNVLYYSGLCYLLAELVGMKPLGIIGDLSNVHLYDNAIEVAQKQLKQRTYKLPKFEFSTKASILFNKFKGEKGFIDYGYYNQLDNVLLNLSTEDFIVENYKSSESIKVEMLAYKN